MAKKIKELEDAELATMEWFANKKNSNEDVLRKEMCNFKPYMCLQYSGICI